MTAPRPRTRREEARRRFAHIRERLERPEVAELVETCPAPVAVARLCRMFGLPEETEDWLAVADAALAQMGFAPPDDRRPARRPTRARPWTRPGSGAGCG